MTHSKTSRLKCFARSKGTFSGKILGEADENEMILHANIGELNTGYLQSSDLTRILDPEPFQSVRAGIPVTRQRRFDVYPDVNVGK